MTHITPVFEQLDVVNEQVVRDFLPLLGQLSTKFAGKNEEQQRFETEANLTRALESPGRAAVFVHRDDEGTIVSTATANLSLTPYTIGWVDDVVTREDKRGLGLGTGGMNALHKWMIEKGARRARLTSTPDKEEAGNLYSKLGYELAGKVWRADLPAVSDSRPHYYDSPDLYIRYATTGGYLIGCANASDCSIPTGHKAWVDGLLSPKDDAMDYDDLIVQAHTFLAGRGATSANIITDTLTSPNLIDAMVVQGYKQRETRLYTLDLPDAA